MDTQPVIEDSDSLTLTSVEREAKSQDVMEISNLYFFKTMSLMKRN